MSTKKTGGASKNGRDSNPKYLGLKMNDGQQTWPGCVLVRQRGTRYRAGQNVGMGKDHTLFALENGRVKISEKRHLRFDNRTVSRKMISVE